MKIKALNKIKKFWTFPPENWEQVKFWWKNDLPISFYSWECPPRRVTEDKKFGKFVNFDIDIKKVVWGEKLDSYTEIPRINTRREEEKWFVENIILKSKNSTYIKFIADTNAIYLYPKSLKILGRPKIGKLLLEFKAELEKFSSLKINQKFPKFLLFTEIQKRFKKEYNDYFNLIMKSFTCSLTSDFVPLKTLKYWESRIIKHVGLTPQMKKERQDLLKRVIASYAAEGMVFYFASRTGRFPNPVWLNWEEKPISGKTTEILRKYFGLEPIPKVYLC